MLPSPAPSIRQTLKDVKTERLSLSRFQTSDLDELSRIFAKDEVWQFPYGRGFSKSMTDAFIDIQIQEWSEYGFGCWVTRLLTTNEIVGYVGLSVPHFLPDLLPAVEVGWRFDPFHWKNGYATEGAEAALREGFQTLGLDKICSAPQTINPPSGEVCKRIGMKFDRVVVAEGNDRRGPVDVDLYWITRDEWERRNK